MNINYIEGSSSDSDDSMKTNQAEQAHSPKTRGQRNIFDLLNYASEVHENGDAVEADPNYDPPLPLYGPEKPHTPPNALAPLDLSNSPSENELQQEDSRAIITLDSTKKKVEWTEKILIPKLLAENFMETRARSPEEFYWKQALWSTLVVIVQTAKTVDIYVGYDRPDLLPRGWGLSTNFRFSLLDSEGTVVAQSDPIPHHFSVPYKAA
eukprot:gene40459-49312_t